ncbi:MAG: DUF3592 domain-containing protein [Bdellovibrionales bacterium]|nr:DUF3592 domain-containing protein [Bdellovibrionales bacterium]
MRNLRRHLQDNYSESRNEDVVKTIRETLENRTSGELALTAGLALVAAVMCTGLSVFSLQKSRIFANSAVAASAEVVEIIKEPVPSESGRPAHILVPVFQYKVAGTVFERRLIGAPTNYSVGDTTTIYYNPENPAEIRDALKAESTTMASVFGGFAAASWALFAFLLVQSIRAVRHARRVLEMRLDGQPIGQMRDLTKTKCIFIALEATTERVQSARLIRLVCKWIHPETGVEHLLRSASFHPTSLPRSLELGMMVSCSVDFDSPNFHEVHWNELKKDSVVTATEDAQAPAIPRPVSA